MAANPDLDDNGFPLWLSRMGKSSQETASRGKPSGGETDAPIMPPSTAKQPMQHDASGSIPSVSTNAATNCHSEQSTWASTHNTQYPGGSVPPAAMPHNSAPNEKQAIPASAATPCDPQYPWLPPIPPDEVHFRNQRPQPTHYRPSPNQNGLLSRPHSVPTVIPSMTPANPRNNQSVGNGYRESHVQGDISGPPINYHAPGNTSGPLINHRFNNQLVGNGYDQPNDQLEGGRGDYPYKPPQYVMNGYDQPNGHHITVPNRTPYYSDQQSEDPGFHRPLRPQVHHPGMVNFQPTSGFRPPPTSAFHRPSPKNPITTNEIINYAQLGATKPSFPAHDAASTNNYSAETIPNTPAPGKAVLFKQDAMVQEALNNDALLKDFENPAKEFDDPGLEDYEVQPAIESSRSDEGRSLSDLSSATNRNEYPLLPHDFLPAGLDKIKLAWAERVWEYAHNFDDDLTDKTKHLKTYTEKLSKMHKDITSKLKHALCNRIRELCGEKGMTGLPNTMDPAKLQEHVIRNYPLCGSNHEEINDDHLIMYLLVHKVPFKGHMHWFREVVRKFELKHRVKFAKENQTNFFNKMLTHVQTANSSTFRDRLFKLHGKVWYDIKPNKTPFGDTKVNVELRQYMIGGCSISGYLYSSAVDGQLSRSNVSVLGSTEYNWGLQLMRLRSECETEAEFLSRSVALCSDMYNSKDAQEAQQKSGNHHALRMTVRYALCYSIPFLELTS